jgi:hypothetical protein
MNYAVVQYEDRDDIILNELMDINRNICNNVREFNYIRDTEIYNLPPWWIKVKIVLDLLHNNQGIYDGVVWLDSDAVINRSQDLLELCKTTKVFLHSGETPFTHFCAGVWFVKNTDIGRSLMTKWFDTYTQYSSSFWIYENNKWTTDYPFAIHPAYEQAACILFVLPLFKTSIVTWNILNRPYLSFLPFLFLTDSATFHFYGAYKIFIPDFINYVNSSSTSSL